MKFLAFVLLFQIFFISKISSATKRNLFGPLLISAPFSLPEITINSLSPNNASGSISNANLSENQLSGSAHTSNLTEYGGQINTENQQGNGFAAGGTINGTNLEGGINVTVMNQSLPGANGQVTLLKDNTIATFNGSISLANITVTGEQVNVSTSKISEVGYATNPQSNQSACLGTGCSPVIAVNVLNTSIANLNN